CSRVRARSSRMVSESSMTNTVFTPMGCSVRIGPTLCAGSASEDDDIAFGHARGKSCVLESRVLDSTAQSHADLPTHRAKAVCSEQAFGGEGEQGLLR